MGTCFGYNILNFVVAQSLCILNDWAPMPSGACNGQSRQQPLQATQTSPHQGRPPAAGCQLREAVSAADKLWLQDAYSEAAAEAALEAFLQPPWGPQGSLPGEMQLWGAMAGLAQMLHLLLRCVMPRAAAPSSNLKRIAALRQDPSLELAEM